MSKEQHGPFDIQMDDNNLGVQVVWKQQRLSAQVCIHVIMHFSQMDLGGISK